MKKIIALLLSVLLLFCCLSFSVSADNSTITISDDYSDIYLYGKRYTRFNASFMQYELIDEITDEITLSTTQEILISDTYLAIDMNKAILHAEFSHYDGSTLTADYLSEDYIEIYNDIMTSDKGTYVIDFMFPEGNTVKTEKTKLMGEYTTVFTNSVYIKDWHDVTSTSPDGVIEVIKGALVIGSDAYYYVDFEEANISNPLKFSPEEYDFFAAYKITDAMLLEEIEDAEDEYYDDDIGFLLDDDFTESVSTVFIILVFAVLPFISLIVFFILSLRSQKTYKKIFSIIWISSAAELIIFTILALLVKFYS